MGKVMDNKAMTSKKDTITKEIRILIINKVSKINRIILDKGEINSNNKINIKSSNNNKIIKKEAQINLLKRTNKDFLTKISNNSHNLIRNKNKKAIFYSIYKDKINIQNQYSLEEFKFNHKKRKKKFLKINNKINLNQKKRIKITKIKIDKVKIIETDQDI